MQFLILKKYVEVTIDCISRARDKDSSDVKLDEIDGRDLACMISGVSSCCCRVCDNQLLSMD